MQKLDDPDPYETLGISPQADKAAISKAYILALRDPNQQKHQVQAAYRALMHPESRLLVDAFTPTHTPSEADLAMINKLLAEGEDDESIDWSTFLDYEKVVHQDLASLTEIIIRSLFADIAAPGSKPTLSKNFDRLDAFIAKWVE